MIGIDPTNTEMKNEAARRREKAVNGTAANENVEPKSEVVAIIDALAEEDIWKSDTRPVVTPKSLRTVMMQAMSTPMRGGLIDEQNRVDAAVGEAVRQEAPL